MLQKIFKTRALRKIRAEVEKLPEIKITKLGRGMFQQRCHDNAYQAHYEEGLDVVACICVGRNGNMFAHIINRSQDWEFVDHTLGYQYKLYRYYLLNNVEVREGEPGAVALLAAKKKTLSFLSSGFLEWVFKVDEVTGSGIV